MFSPKFVENKNYWFKICANAEKLKQEVLPVALSTVNFLKIILHVQKDYYFS